VQHEFNSRNNNKAHRTDEISKERLIARRGQVFSITLRFNRTFRQGFDKLQLTVETGPQPSVSDGTRSVFDVPSTAKSKSWGATIQSTQQNEVTLAVSSPPDACIGTYTLTVQTGIPPTSNNINRTGSFILLFNPWCSVLRCLGIPARVITNFASAHDSDGNLSIDTYIGGTESSDSIWNFHVWVEAWMRRSDLLGDYGGWQVVDATPQESSEGLMRCGPAPVKAILEGHTKVKYDVPFVFAEVNADEVTWVIQPDGSKRKVMSNPRSVGMNIRTKAVGKNERQDVTNNYKYPEGGWELHLQLHLHLQLDLGLSKRYTMS
ncbi:TGM2 glutamyltransferase, partial [Amia calva]|nr:TGM2 glutamyltransferase [Amia calva]